MAITPDLIKRVTAQLYERSLRRIPADAMAALQKADAVETNPTARHTLRIRVESAQAAEQGGQQKRTLPHPPAVDTRPGLVEPEQAEGRHFGEGQKDQHPVDDGQVDPAARCA